MRLLLSLALAGCSQGSYTFDEGEPEPGPHDSAPSAEDSDDDSGGDSAPSDGDDSADCAPRMEVEPATLLFGEVVIPGTSVQTFTIWNTGCADLFISRISQSGSDDYRQVNDADATTLESGWNLAVAVLFAPTSAGAHEGLLRIASDADNGIVDVTLTADAR